LIIASIFRLKGLDRVPVSLFADELDVGYQAYSILKTGRDYFGHFMPLHFESYVEFRAPVYIYSTVPTVAIFGMTLYGIRLPAAIFGILGVLMMYLFTKELTKNEKLSLLTALIMALNPWHIHYSRAAFEVTELISLLLSGLYFMLRGFEKPKLFFVSAVCFALMPWTYSTAKLFTPFFLIFLFIVWFRDFFKVPNKYLKKPFFILLVSALLFIYALFFAGGAYRFSQISVFSDPSRAAQIADEHLIDGRMKIANGGGIISSIESRLAHNKINFWNSTIVTNYLKSFSTEFLFLKGDVSHRHSDINMGQFYKFEAILLVLGVILFYKSKFDTKIKALISFWILFGAVPAALTVEGGAHATRLMLIMPPLVFLIAYGLYKVINIKIVAFCYVVVLLISVFLYQHDYWVHYPWYSEKSWHAGYKEAIVGAQEYSDQYDKIVITNAEERPYIFIAAYTKFDPALWQKGFEEGYVPGFGDLKKIGKYYVGQVDGTIKMAKLSEYMDSETLYVASAREVDADLVAEPQRTPLGLNIVKSITLPSGEPVFYLFSKAN